MNDSDYQRIRESYWGNSLTPEEETQLQAFLAEHPEVVRDWEEEVALHHLLGELSDAPLASNFTARVMQSVRQDQRLKKRPFIGGAAWKRWSHRLFPRLAWTTVVTLLCGTAYIQHQSNLRNEFERTLAEKVTPVAALPDLQILQDFDAINHLRRASAASDEALIDFLR